MTQKRKTQNQPQGVKKTETQRREKPPIQLDGILFALAANILLVTTAQLLLIRTNLPSETEALATFVSPVVAGITTALYIRPRGGIHAFLGGMLSVPLLTYIVFGGYWQPALLAGAFCGLSGSITEVLMRRG